MPIIYLTVIQAAEQAQLHRQTIADALRDSRLHGAQRSKRGTWRIQQDCLAAWMNAEPCAHRLALKAAA